MRIIVADDHPLYREALVTRVERIFPDAIVSEFDSLDAASASTADEAEPTDLYLLDYHMPGVTIETLGRLVQDRPRSRVAVISGITDADEVRALIRTGVHGFIPKTARAAYLQHALQMLLAGGTSVPTEYLIGSPSPPPPRAGERPAWVGLLTERETEVMACLSRGLSNKEIGRELGLAEVTVKLHVSGIFRKTGAHSRSEAAVLASQVRLD